MNKLFRILFIVVLGLFVAGSVSADLGSYWRTISDIIPRTDNQVDIGSSSKRVKKIYTKELDAEATTTLSGNVGIGTSTAPTTALVVIGISTMGTIIPHSDSTYNLGGSSNYWANTYTDKIYLNDTATLDGTGGAGWIRTVGNIAPSVNNTGNLGGTNNRWNYAYINRIYIGGTKYIDWDSSMGIYVNETFRPSSDSSLSLGWSTGYWLATYTDELVLQQGTMGATAADQTRLAGLDLAPGDAGLHIKTENDTEHLFASKVGIATTTPEGIFVVATSSGASVFHIDSTGKVGIGLSSPDSIFHIKAGTSGTVGSHPAGQLIIQNPTDSVFSNVVITGYESDGSGNPDQQLWYLGSSSGGNTDIIFLNRRNAKLQLGTNGSSRLTILGDGNVGIATSTPSEKLVVDGYALFDQAYGSLAEDTIGEETGSTIVATTTGVFYVWQGASSTLSSQAGADYITYTIASGATSTLTVGSKGAGVYQASFNIAMSISAVNQVIHCAVFKNGAKLRQVSGEVKAGITTDVVTLSGGANYVPLVASDELTLRCANETSGGDTLTVNHANLAIHRISR